MKRTAEQQLEARHDVLSARGERLIRTVLERQKTAVGYAPTGLHSDPDRAKAFAFRVYKMAQHAILNYARKNLGCSDDEVVEVGIALDRMLAAYGAEFPKARGALKTLLGRFEERTFDPFQDAMRPPVLTKRENDWLLYFPDVRGGYFSTIARSFPQCAS